MATTGELVAAEEEISREELDDVTGLRYAQYQRSLENDREFQKRVHGPRHHPAEAQGPDRRGRRLGRLPDDQDGLAKLEPVAEGGVVTFGSQTHPADGTAGMIVTGEEKARGSRTEMASSGCSLRGSHGSARPGCPRPRSRRRRRPSPTPASSISGVDVIKTHNPFAVNDAYFARQMGVQIKDMNNYGSSLIFGHPQGPTGARLISEMIEELRAEGRRDRPLHRLRRRRPGAAVVVRVED